MTTALTTTLTTVGHPPANSYKAASLAHAARGTRWYQRAADAGHTSAMFNLGVLLADRWDPPDLPAARTWFERAADAGHTGAMVNLGVLAAERGDAVGATCAWQRVIDSDHADDEYVANAALCMAAISALTGQIGLAGELLRLAGQRGSSEASAYAATLDQDSPDRLEALRNLGRRTEDTDALNFLGIAAKVDGDLEKARASWDASVSRAMPSHRCSLRSPSRRARTKPRPARLAAANIVREAFTTDIWVSLRLVLSTSYKTSDLKETRHPSEDYSPTP